MTIGFSLTLAPASAGTDLQPISPKLWSSGFLSGEYAGVAFRTKGAPVLYLDDPAGMSRAVRRDLIDAVNAINQKTFEEVGDPETHARIQQYELAFRMQFEAQDAFDIGKEPESVRKMYGDGEFANACLIARRLAERGVRITQIYYGDGQPWDDHSRIAANLRGRCPEMDRASAALIIDLKRRGLLDETAIIWGGEFGRTPVVEGGTGRDHNPYGYTMWLAGGGVKGGQAVGADDTGDEFHLSSPTRQVSVDPATQKQKAPAFHRSKRGGIGKSTKC